MTPYGYYILLLASELIDKDCPKARSGGASLAAALVLKVPPETIVDWLKDAEQLFAKEVQITWLHATKPRTFQEWLCAARRSSPTRLAHVPANAADDAVLAAQMCAKEHFLLRLVPRRRRLDLFLCAARLPGPLLEESRRYQGIQRCQAP